MTTATSSLIIKLIDEVTNPANKAGKAVNAFEKELLDLQSKARKMDAFRQGSRDLDQASLAFKRAKEQAARLKTELANAESPTKKMQAALAQAERQAERTKTAFMTQGRAVRTAMQEMGAAGVQVNKLAAAEAALKSKVDATTAAMKRQETAAAHMAAVEERRRRVTTAMEGPKLLAAGAGVYAAAKGKELAKNAILAAVEFDLAVKGQQAAAGVSVADQKRILIPQATRIGQETPFSNEDVVKAQTASMQGLPAGFSSKLKAEIATGILENVKNYAMMMEADLSTSAQAVRSYLQATNKDISTKEKALAEARKATNQLVAMGKIGGMSDEDIQQFMKYAAPSGTAAGLSPETMMSLGVLARTSGLRGDEAGVFVRSASSKLVSPTRDGMAALQSAGIDYNKYTTMPGGLSVDNFGLAFQNDLGKTITEKQRQKLAKIMEDDELIADRGKFTAAVTKVMESSFLNRNGKVSATDSKKIAKSAGNFHKLSVESVDTEGLLRAIMNSNMGLALLNAFFTDKHGGKAAILQNQFDQFQAIFDELIKAAADPNFAKDKADLKMSGIGGAFENLKGSVENLTLSFGMANEGILKLSFDKLGSAFDWVSSLSDETKQKMTAWGVGGGLGVAGASLWSLSSLLTAGPALTSSAAALDGAAVALTRAAVAQGATGLPGTVPPGTKPGTGNPWTGLTALLLPIAIAQAEKAAVDYVFDNHMPKPSKTLPEGYDLSIGGAFGRLYNDIKGLINAPPPKTGGQYVQGDKPWNLKWQPAQDGIEAGQETGQGVQQGLQQATPQILSEAVSVMDRLKQIFGVGVNVPLHFASPPGVGATPAAPATSPAVPATPGKQSTYSPTFNYTVNGSGDPERVANLLEQRQRRDIGATSRGSFSDYGFG